MGLASSLNKKSKISFSSSQDLKTDLKVTSRTVNNSLVKLAFCKVHLSSV